MKWSGSRPFRAGEVNFRPQTIDPNEEFGPLSVTANKAVKRVGDAWQMVLNQPAFVPPLCCRGVPDCRCLAAVDNNDMERFLPYGER
jgi:hypothetical protein